ncbi:MAG: hypothetical protein IJ793_04015 [Opitutales bacterium]|nr:hypothetical protein [Opitutales bacterium]
MKLSVGIGGALCTCMFQAWRAYDDGQNGALLNSDGCLVAGARVECCACRGKNTKGIRRLLLFSAKVRRRWLCFSSFCFDFFLRSLKKIADGYLCEHLLLG